MGAFDGTVPDGRTPKSNKVEQLKRFHESNSITALREVTVRYLDEDEIITEKISDKSPLGIATLYRRPGEIVQVNGPKGVYEVEILEME